MDSGSKYNPSNQCGSNHSDYRDKDIENSVEPLVQHREDLSKSKTNTKNNGNIKNQHSSNPPILISTLTLTENHPLMSYSSPDSPPSTGNFPDLILHSNKNNALSSESPGIPNLNSVDDECFSRNILSGEICSLYGEGFSPQNGPQRNTSKNNLYISDNLISPDSNKSLDGDHLRSNANVAEYALHSKSNIQPDVVDSGRKLNIPLLGGSYLGSSNFSFGKHSCNIGEERLLKDENAAFKIHNSLSITPLESCTKTDDNTSQSVESKMFEMRENSWSNSESSIDSICGCSIKSDGEFVNQDDRNSGHVEVKSSNSEKIPEYSLNDERNDSKKWLKILLPSGERRSVDMKVIEPYKRVLSHGGYALSERRDAIVVFSACFLPDSARVDYNYVMDNLFLYVLSTMEQLVTDDYILIYLHGSASKRSMPTFHWLKKCYQLIDRRLRKSLKHLYLVHPTFWLKSVMFMTRPFISSKFFNKLTYVHSLHELCNYVPVECAAIPECVKRYDSMRS